MPRLGDLVNAVRAAYPTMPEIRRGRGIKTAWHRPPLYLGDAQLSGIPLQEFIRPHVTLKASEMRGIFEEYVQLFLVEKSDQSSSDWLRQRLSLNARVADWYFPKGAQHIAALLWYAGFAETARLHVDGPDCIVRIGDAVVDGIEFGVRDGKLLSKFHSDFTCSTYTDFGALLSEQHKVGNPRISHDLGLASFWHHTHFIEDPEMRETVQLALRILFYKFGHLGRLVDYLYKGFNTTPRNRYGHVKTCERLFAELMDYPNPMPRIAEKLHRHFLSEEELVDAFGADFNTYRATPLESPVELGPVLRWGEALKKLAKTKLTKGEEQE